MPTRRTFIITAAMSAFGTAGLRERAGRCAADQFRLDVLRSGSSGYVEASAIAEAMQKQHKMRVRIMPSGTSIGRLLPIKQGRATYGYLANELFFATEGTEDFARPRRGGRRICASCWRARPPTGWRWPRTPA